VGHAVRAGYLYSGVADVAALTGDTAYFHALTRIWDNMASRKLYITGGVGSRAQGEGYGPNDELNNHTAYCETCAAIATVFWNYRMFLATGDAKYMDVLERGLYNGVIAGVSLSGDLFFYDNPLASMGEHARQRWFGCACCPGNITRFMASVPQYMYAVQGNDVYVNLYIQSKADVTTAYNGVQNDITLEQTTSYPWNGAITIAVTPKTESEFALRFRIPGWAHGTPVPTDLYAYVSPKPAYTVSVNGKKVNAQMSDDGYVTVSRTWKAGDTVELDFPMEVQQVKANDNVEDDRGRLSIERGPIVFCLEGKDQEDGTVFNKYITANATFDTHYDATLLGGVMVLKTTGYELAADGTTKETTLTAIPYSTWNNRGADQMEVWIADGKTTAVATPAPTIASRAKTREWGANDQWEPKRSSDTSRPYHYWWLKNGSTEEATYLFEEPTKVSSVDVYWLDFDHYDGDFRVPQSWTLLYQDGKTWKPVKTSETYGVAKDTYNHTAFEPVTTTGLRIRATLQKGVSGGIIEWKVN
jgi:DUF1680 family protein